MATTEFTPRLSLTTTEKMAHAAEAGFARLAAAWKAWRNRRAVASLLEWDANMLKDIGLTQGDVLSALAAPVSEDPSYRLGVMSVERRSAFQATAQERFVRGQTPGVRSKSETLAAINRPPRRVRPHRTLEI
jgi:uncharacterized protein YjiS (DUF1127 family)